MAVQPTWTTVGFVLVAFRTMLKTPTKIVLAFVSDRRLRTSVQRATPTQLMTARKTALEYGAARPLLITVVSVLAEPPAI